MQNVRLYGFYVIKNIVRIYFLKTKCDIYLWLLRYFARGIGRLSAMKITPIVPGPQCAPITGPTN